MNESDARAAFRAMGIPRPSQCLIDAWLRAAEWQRLAEDKRTPNLPSTKPNTTAAERGGVIADIPISGPDLNDAITSLEAQGKRTTQGAVREWLAQHRPTQAAPAAVARQPAAPEMSQPEPPTDQKKEHSSSRLARFAVPPAGSQPRRKPGRPLTIASWFPAVAETMADGTRLRTALAIRGLTLSANEMRSLYRNKTFKGLYQEARRRYLIENWGRSKTPSLRRLLGRCL